MRSQPPNYLGFPVYARRDQRTWSGRRSIQGKSLSLWIERLKHIQIYFANCIWYQRILLHMWYPTLVLMLKKVGFLQNTIWLCMSTLQKENNPRLILTWFWCHLLGCKIWASFWPIPLHLPSTLCPRVGPHTWPHLPLNSRIFGSQWWGLISLQNIQQI